MTSTWNGLIETLQAGQAVVLAMVVESRGSAPGKRGFKMVVDRKGRLQGTIGGGIMEARIIERCQELLKRQQDSNQLLLQIHNEQADRELLSGMICSGNQRILLQPFYSKDLAALEQVYAADLQSTPVMLVFDSQGMQIEPAPSEIQEDPGFRLQEKGTWRYRETVGQRDTFYIVGGGHVGFAISQTLAPLGFHLVIFDHRPHLETLATNPFVHRKIIGPYEDIGKHVQPGLHSYVAVVSASFQSDMEALASLIEHPLKYLGLMGSMAKVKRIFTDLRAQGIAKEQLKKVTAPMGLPIGNRTPAEIAISLAAQVVAVRNGV